MPTWGITAEMRDARPWGLDPDLLKPAKTQTDAVHEDIYWTELERRFIDSRPFQRLRSVKQLGTTNRVYPTAEHSRLTHCLGTLRVAQDIIDRVLSARTGPHPIDDLFDSWAADGYICRLAEAVVLARLSSLMHDLTHVPFGHTIEDDLEILTSHDKNPDRFDLLWGLLPEVLRPHITNATTRFPRDGRFSKFSDELRAIILDKVPLLVEGEPPDSGRTNVERSNYPFVSDIVNNTICADLLDYLVRDHLFLGLPIGLGDRFMDNMYVAREGDDISFPERLVVRITRQAAPRTDTTTEILKHLRYRYEETERALYHKTKLAYDAMLGKLLEMLADEYWLERAMQDFPALEDEHERTDADWVHDRVRDLIGAAENAGPVNSDHPRLRAYDAVVHGRLEKLLLSFGDEALLQYLIWHWTEEIKPPNSRVTAIVTLAERVLYREGFKVVGHTVGEASKREAGQKHGKWGGAAERRRLERYAARVAGVADAWNVVIWLPSPSMRLKVAEVLVDDGQSVYKLGEHDPDAKQIVERHKGLWAMRLYAPSEIRDNRRTNEVLRGCILEKTGINLADERGNPARNLSTLAADRVGDLIPLTTPQEDDLADLVAAARADEWTFDDALREAWAAALAKGWTAEEQPPNALFQ